MAKKQNLDTAESIAGWLQAGAGVKLENGNIKPTGPQSFVIITGLGSNDQKKKFLVRVTEA